MEDIETLCLIYRKSLAEGSFRKEANVIPRKGDLHQPNAYWPINLTFVMCKVFNQ